MPLSPDDWTPDQGQKVIVWLKTNQAFTGKYDGKYVQDEFAGRKIMWEHVIAVMPVSLDEHDV